jgi:hypothetical protein
MADTNIQQEENTPSQIIDMRPDVLVRVALLGLGLGAVTWVVSFLMSKFATGPMFCPGGGTCEAGDAIAGNVTLVLASVVGMLVLVRQGVYRPMLIVIAAALTLWNIGGWLSGIVWYEAIGWSALIYMVTYVAYAWLVRLKNFVIVLVVLAALIIFVRYISSL